MPLPSVTALPMAANSAFQRSRLTKSRLIAWANTPDGLVGASPMHSK